MEGLELKWKFHERDTVIVDNPDNLVGAGLADPLITPSNLIIPLNGVARGDTGDSRDGIQVTNQCIELRYTVEWPGAALGIQFADYFSPVSVSLWWDNAPNKEEQEPHTAPKFHPEDYILKSTAISQRNGCGWFLDPCYEKRFEILYREEIDCLSPAIGWYTATNGTSAGVTETRCVIVDLGGKVSLWDDSGNETLNTLITGALHLVVWKGGGIPAFNDIPVHFHWTSLFRYFSE